MSEIPPLPLRLPRQDSFPRFPLFPGEIQNLIWDQAASLSPAGVHFLASADSSPSSSWATEDITLVPCFTSAALNTVHLSLTCRDARAAVIRYKKSITHKTWFILRCDGAGGANRPEKISMNLALDLRRDLICFVSKSTAGNGDGDARAAIDCAEGHHIVFTAARRFGIRYRKGWEIPGNGPFQHDVRCLAGWRRGIATPRAGKGGGFCSRCVARVVERFRRLEELWVIVDENGDDNDDEDEDKVEGGGGWNGTDAAKLGGRRFEGYEMSYVSVGREQVESAAVKEAVEVLERIKSNLMDPRYGSQPWVGTLNMGILIARP